MSEYKGPSFKRHDQRPVSERRFNRLTQRNGQDNIFKTAKEQESYVNNEGEHYQLPHRIEQISNKTFLPKPINKEKLHRNLERVKQLENQTINEKGYKVPFLNQTKINSTDFNYEELKKQQEILSKTIRKKNRSHHYQTAYNTDRFNGTHVVEYEEHSLSDRDIRTIAMRLIKEKSDFLLFENS